MAERAESRRREREASPDESDASPAQAGDGSTGPSDAELDERRVARLVARGLPVLTLLGALGTGLFLNAAMAILVLAGGVLLGVIALFWASLRVLSGDAPLPEELEALDTGGHAVDALAERQKMLLRALKDLDNERAVGKLDDDDHEQLARRYRAELTDVMKRIDESLAPHRTKAEEAARAHLAKVGLDDNAKADDDATEKTSETGEKATTADAD